MLIDDKKWNDIITAARTRIDKWNGSAAKHGLKDTFRVSTQKTDRYEVILTEHRGGGVFEANALAREIATGEVRSTRVIRKKGHITGFQTTTPDPKYWKSLADKSAGDIIMKVRLVDFLMAISASSSVTSVQTTKPTTV